MIIVYGLFSTEDGRVRYIGQTNRDSVCRLKDHFSEALRAHGGEHIYKNRWINKTIRDGFQVQIVVLKENAVWNVDEIELIRYYRSIGFKLVNSTDGGGGLLGANFSPEHRTKIATALRGIVRSESTRAKISQANSGKIRSEPCKENMRKKMAGNKRRLGAVTSTARKQEISRFMKGNKYRKGIPHSESDKKRISSSLKKAYLEGRRPPVDIEISTKQLNEWNRKVRAGEVILPWKKVERNRKLLAFHLKTKSLKETANKFGIDPSSAWEIVKKYAPHQLLSKRGSKCIAS